MPAVPEQTRGEKAAVVVPRQTAMLPDPRVLFILPRAQNRWRVDTAYLIGQALMGAGGHWGRNTKK